MRHTQGFTLIELILVIMLLGIISVIASKIFSQGISAYLNEQYLMDADWQGRFALERMARRLHVVRSPNDITTATASNFSFTDINGNTWNYQLSGSNLLENSNTLANGINNLTFTYLTNTGATTATLTAIYYVQISMTITLNSTNFTLNTTVNLRNSI
jgi:prepilin-type N-terminal cleavage/methylation domain-containing protein